MAKCTLKSNWLTARQLGLILEQVLTEIKRTNVAKFAVPRLVVSSHAYGFSSKFENCIYQSDFIKLFASQH